MQAQSFHRSSKSHKFISAVYRRMLIVRSIEQLAIGMLVASLLSVALLLVASSQNTPTLPVLIFSGFIGLFIGALLAVYRKPSRAFAAAEADRQLRFDDLLTTMLYARVEANDAFAKAVSQMADARCQRHSPDDVILRQMGLRSWSVVGLAMSVAVTLSVIPLNADKSVAADANAGVLFADTPDNSAMGRHEMSLDQSATVMRSNDPSSEDSSAHSMATRTVGGKSAQSNSLPMGPRGTNSSGNQAGSAGGRATSSAKSPVPDLMPNESSHSLMGHEQLAGGGEEAGHNSDGSDRAIGTSVSHGGPSAVAPRWHGDGTTYLPQGGLPALNNIPSEDRDLVRDFFDRP